MKAAKDTSATAPAKTKAAPTVDAAVLGSPAHQVWKAERGICIVKGCNDRSVKGGLFCSKHAQTRKRMAEKGKPMDMPTDDALTMATTRMNKIAANEARIKEREAKAKAREKAKLADAKAPNKVKAPKKAVNKDESEAML